MNSKRLFFVFLKLATLGIILSFGTPFVYRGFLMLQEEPSPEKPFTFMADMRPKAGPTVGTVIVRLEPIDAFVIGEKIIADIEVQVNWVHDENETETVSILFTFTDCLAIDENWAWINRSYYNWMIFPEYNYSMATYAVYKARAFLWYTHEGIFGANVTVYSPYSLELLRFPDATLEGTVNWSFPNIVRIKSYDYIEERANTQFTNALSVEILGLTIIAISPIAVEIISLFERAYDSIVEKPRNTRKEVEVDFDGL